MMAGLEALVAWIGASSVQEEAEDIIVVVVVVVVRQVAGSMTLPFTFNLLINICPKEVPSTGIQ